MRASIILVILLFVSLLGVMRASSGVGESSYEFVFLNAHYVTNYTDPLYIGVYLGDSGVPLSGYDVAFYLVNGTEELLIGLSKTNSTGVAILAIPAVYYPPRSYGLKAIVEVNNETLEALASLSVNRETTVLRVTSNTSVEYSDSAVLVVRLTTDNDEILRGYPVVCTFYLDGSPAFSLVSSTNEYGYAIFMVNSSMLEPFGVRNVDVIFEFRGDAFYEGSFYKATLSIEREGLELRVSTSGRFSVGSKVVFVIQVVDDDGTPVVGAEVRVFVGDDLVDVGKTDQSGVFEATWVPSEGGNYTVVVYAMKTFYENATYTFTIYVEGILEGSDNYDNTPYIVVGVLLIVALGVAVYIIRYRKTK